MYFNSRRKRKPGLPWFDIRTDWEKSSDEYYENLDDLAQQLDDVEEDSGFCTSLDPEDFDSAYGYVYGRIKELKEYFTQKESSEESDHVNIEEARETLQDIYEDLLDLYDSALLYDNYSGADPDDSDEDDDWDDEDLYDEEDDWDDDNL